MRKQFKILLIAIFVVVCMSTLVIVLTSCSLLEGLLSTHTHEYIETVVEATCEEQGYTLKKCECGDEKKVNEVAALGHEYKDVYTIDKNATCTEEGSKSRHCKRCSDKIDVQSISAIGHNYATTYTVDVRATCEANGSESKHCSRCSSSIEPRPIAALGHDYAETKTIDKNATCTIDGLRSRHCSRCSSTIDAEIILRLGHNYSSMVTLDKEATCTEDGQTSCHCSRCDSKINIEILPKLGHNIMSEILVEPTCAEEGYTQYNCSRCDGYKDNFIPKINHSFKKGVCTTCNYKDVNYYSEIKYKDNPYAQLSKNPLQDNTGYFIEYELSSNLKQMIIDNPNKILQITLEFDAMCEDTWALGSTTGIYTAKSNGEKYYCQDINKITLDTKTYKHLTFEFEIPASSIIDGKLYFHYATPTTANLTPRKYWIKNVYLGASLLV